MFTEDEIAKLHWLKIHLDPRETVLENWVATFVARRNLLKNKISIHEYYKLFKCLSVAEGVELVRFQNNEFMLLIVLIGTFFVYS